MARTPKRLFGPAQLTNAAATKYTTPAVTKTIIRHIHIQNPSTAVTFTISIGADAAGVRIYDATSIAANASVDYFGYWVVEAAEIVQAYASVASQLVLTLNGDEYTLG